MTRTNSGGDETALSQQMPEETHSPRQTKPGESIMRYRSDIDGLRAIAVLSVVFYHLGVPWITGGYVGVDIFFVISGFLITRIIHREAIAGTFSVLHFYERRARRILPALIVVVLCTIIGAHFLLAPFEYDDFGLSTLATMFFAANFHFKDAINYFQPASEFHPLLHNWSLAVEEQFYLAFPLLLVLALRFGRVTGGVLVLLGLSFAASILAVTTELISRETAFYMLPMRAWELLIGSVLALQLVPVPAKRSLREGAALTGLVLIAVALLALTSQTPFPGWAALLPCLGAALIILAGEGGRTIVSRFLSLKPMVFVGLISYSLYLWHWPVLALLRYDRSNVHLPPGDLAMAFVVALLAAIASWWFVEKPFRNSKWLSRKQVFALSAAGIVVPAVLGLIIHQGNGLPGRLSPGLQLLAAGATDYEPRRKSCDRRRTVDTLCKFGPADAPVDTLLWGDSHASALVSGVEFAQKARGRALLLATGPGCVPLLGVRFISIDGKRAHAWKSCDTLKERVISWLEQGDHTIKTVVLAARWALAATARYPRGEFNMPLALVPVGGPVPGRAQARRTATTLFAKGLDETLRRLKAAGLKVILIGSVPEIGWNVPRKLVANAWRGKQPPVTMSFAQVTRRQAPAARIIRRLAARYGAKNIELAPLMCKPRCRTVFKGHPLYIDDDHLSMWGSRNLVGPWLVPHFKANAEL